MCLVVGRETLAAPPSNEDIISVIKKLDHKVDRLNSTLTGKVETVEESSKQLTSAVRNVDKKVGIFDNLKQFGNQNFGLCNSIEFAS